jgi:NodT family efflux transporter outer membrane factor (OMF) lipoprotein
MNPRIAGLAAATALVLNTACTVGPRYTRPMPPMTPAYKELPPGNDQWKTSTPRDGEIKGKWWEIFNDPQLNALEESIGISNQNVKVAEANFRQARALVAVNRSGYYPSIGVNPGITTSESGGGSRSSITGARGAAGTTNLFSIPFSASWEPDLWGRVRLSVENASETAQAVAGDLQNIRLSYQTTLASDYFQLLGTDMQLKLLDDTIEAYQKALTLTVNRYHGGVASQADVAQAKTQLETTRAQRTDLIVTRDQYEHAIAVLTGQPPANLSIPHAAIPGPPPPVPVGMPSQLLERRPDIAAAERRVAAANAEIGLAQTAYFPTLTLSASAGLENNSLANLFTWPARLWSGGPSLSQTLFDFGKRRAQVQQTEAAYDAAVATYRQTVLSAFQEVEDNLTALHVLEAEAAQEDVAVKSAKQSVALELDRYKGGTDSFLNVITTQTIALSDERTAVTILQRRMTSAIGLISALGGGWNAANLPNPEQLRKPGSGGSPVAATGKGQ